VKKLVSFPYTFVLLNWAALVALYYFLTNRKDVWVKNNLSVQHIGAHNTHSLISGQGEQS
jgi:hypothetical protein